MIAVVETLPKFHGNLYNWYDTASLSILPPGFVSTVDSGNLACCFVALREGIIDYREEDKRAGKLIEKIDRLIEETDLSVFYDAHKDLFSIGWDSAARQMSGSHYDMLMSEARMTSFFAIACGQVPARHWGALSLSLIHI